MIFSRINFNKKKLTHLTINLYFQIINLQYKFMSLNYIKYMDTWIILKENQEREIIIC